MVLWARDLLLTMPNYHVSTQFSPGERGNEQSAFESTAEAVPLHGALLSHGSVHIALPNRKTAF